MEYFTKAATPQEAKQLMLFVPTLEKAATQNKLLPPSEWEFVQEMVARLMKLPVEKLLNVLDYSSLAQFYNIGLLGSVHDPRELQLRLNIYPDFPGDVEYHTHRTRVSSLILSGNLTNRMFGYNAIQPNDSGDHRIVRAERTEGKSILRETDYRAFMPVDVSPKTHPACVPYAIPVESFHSVTTSRATVTLCLFKRDREYRDSLIFKKRGARLQEDPIDPISDADTLHCIRETLRTVLDK